MKRTFSYDEMVRLIESLASLIHGKSPIVKESITVFFFPETPYVPRYFELVRLIEKVGLLWHESRKPMPTGATSFLRGEGIEDYLLYRKANGNNRVQLTLHGLEEQHDEYVGRRGSYSECFKAAKMIYECDCFIEWMLFVNKSNLPDVREIKQRIADISPPGQYSVSPSIPTYIENAMDIDSLRLESDDVDTLPEEDREALYKMRKTEMEYIADAQSGAKLNFWSSLDHPEITISADGTVARSNFAYEPIGSLHQKSIHEILCSYREKTRREDIMYSVSHAELAAECGDAKSKKLYSPYGIWIKWMKTYLENRHLPIGRRRDYLS